MNSYCVDCGLDLQCCIHRFHQSVLLEFLAQLMTHCPTTRSPEAHCVCEDRYQEYLQELYWEVITNLPPEVGVQKPQASYLRSLYFSRISGL